MPRHYILDGDDEAILRRWKGNGFQVYTEPTYEDEREVVFQHGSFVLKVEAGMAGVPIFNNDDREILTMALDEFEAEPQAVKR